MFLRYRIATLVVLSFAIAAPAFCWGDEGHRLVALIAERHMTNSQAKQALRTLLGGHSLASISTCPDQWRDSSRPDTAHWHFVNIPINEPAYVASRDCKHDDCIIPHLEDFIRQLGNKSLSPTDRLEALIFLTHFAGDLHQPLHDAVRITNGHGDAGGASVMVTVDHTQKKLHSVWDTTLIADEHRTETQYLKHLENDVLGTKPPSSFVTGTITDWANHSHDLARDHAYALPADLVLTTAYITSNEAVVDEQLLAAGLRLASILDNALKDPGNVQGAVMRACTLTTP
jgi:hypothetical protein